MRPVPEVRRGRDLVKLHNQAADKFMAPGCKGFLYRWAMCLGPGFGILPGFPAEYSCRLLEAQGPAPKPLVKLDFSP